VKEVVKSTKAETRVREKTTQSLARQHQEMDRDIVGGGSGGNGGPFTVEEDCP